VLNEAGGVSEGAAVLEAMDLAGRTDGDSVRPACFLTGTCAVGPDVKVLRQWWGGERAGARRAVLQFVHKAVAGRMHQGSARVDAMGCESSRTWRASRMGVR
jgi:hypothetical protein